MRIRNHTGKKQGYGGLTLPYEGWMDCEPTSRLAIAAYKRGHIDWEITSQDVLRKDVIHWKSPFSLADGYATAAEQMCMALDDLGINLHMEPCWFDETAGLRDWTLNKLNEPFPGFMDVGVCMATPGEFHLLPTRYRIGYTMYESDKPLERYPEWRHDCDKADMLAVPSVYCRDVFRGFFKRDIVVAPLVVSDIYYQPKKRQSKDIFTFVSYGTLSKRKSPLETIECFQKAFPDRNDVRLVLKTRFGVCGYSYHQLPQLDDPRIEVISTGKNQQNPKGELDWSAETVRDWLYGADCMVFLSKGEGYGLPPREAQATGLPLIFACNTGMQDIQGGYPVPTQMVEESPIGGYWRIPDWDYAIDMMRWVVEHREDAYENAYEEACWTNRMAGATVLATILSDVSGYSLRQPIKAPEDDHSEFYDIVAQMGGPMLDLGGNAAEGLRKRGIKVYVLPPHWSYADIDKSILRRQGIPEVRTIVSQGVFQDYHIDEIRIILNACLRVAPVVFSVPSVHSDQPTSEWCRLGWRRQWEDLLNGYSKELRFYAKKRQIMAYVKGFGLPANKLNGWTTRDGIWRALDGTED